MRRVLPLLAVFGLLLAACGGSSSKAASSSTTQAPAATASASGSGATTSTTVPTFTGSSNSKYCQFAKQVEAKSSAQTGTDLKSTFADFDGIADQFLSNAPSAIKTDAKTLVDGMKQYEKVLKAANFDLTKVNPTDLQVLQDPKFEQSAVAVDAYNKQVCGIDADSSTDTSAP